MTKTKSERRIELGTKITVMMSPAVVPDYDNPFVHLLADNLGPDIEVVDFRWFAAFFSRYQVLHIHWPERMTSNPNRIRSVAKSVAFMLLVVLNRARSVVHVGTVHNVNPHEGVSRIEHHAISLWQRSCDARIYLTRSGLEADATGVGVYIPHGDYEPFVAALTDAVVPAEDGRLLAFGYLRPYKGLEELIVTVSAEPSLRLIIAGRAISNDYANLLKSASGPTVELHMRSQTPAELVTHITRAEAVVLPYRRIYNSGAAILALTLGRPIIVTSSPSMEELQREVGAGWVQLLPPQWGVADVNHALTEIRRAARSGPAPLQGRAWKNVGLSHAALYKSLTYR